MLKAMMISDEDKDGPYPFDLYDWSRRCGVYQDSIKVTMKGLETKLVIVLTIFPTIDFLKQQVPKSGYMNGILNAKYTYVSLSMEYTMNGLDYMNGARVKKELENGGICFGWETADDGRV